MEIKLNKLIKKNNIAYTVIHSDLTNIVHLKNVQMRIAYAKAPITVFHNHIDSGHISIILRLLGNSG